MMNIQFMPELIFCNIAFLTDISIALAGFSTLTIPVRTIIWFIATFPAWVSAPILTNIFIPALSRAKSLFFFLLLSHMGIEFKIPPTHYASANNWINSAMRMLTPAIGFSCLTSNFYLLSRTKDIRQMYAQTFSRACVPVIVRLSDGKRFTANDTYKRFLSRDTIPSAKAFSRAKASKILGKRFSAPKRFPAKFATCFNQYSTHNLSLKVPALSVSARCLGVRAKGKHINEKRRITATPRQGELYHSS